MKTGKSLWAAVIVIVLVAVISISLFGNHGVPGSAGASGAKSSGTVPPMPNSASVKAAPTTDANGNPLPVLTSVMPSSVAVGTAVTVKGTGLVGFEGDKNLWIRDASGASAIIYGTRDSGAADPTSIVFTLASKYCTVDESYKGAACPSYLTIIPGVYSLAAKPWSTESNRLPFVVVKK